MAKKKTIEVTVGEKVTEKFDESKAYKTHPVPEPASGGEVEGHAIIHKLSQCPWCGALGWIWYDTCAYHTYICHNCGMPYRQ